MNKRILFFLACFLFLNSCKDKIYYPDENSYRDPDLVGTWIYINEDTTEIFPQLQIFTEEGYYGNVSYTDNAQLVGYPGLHNIWYVTKTIDGGDWGEFYVGGTSSGFTHRRNEHYENYRFSLKKDSLFLEGLYFVGEEEFDFGTYVKYKHPLIYNGPNFVGIDSTNTKK